MPVARPPRPVTRLSALILLLFGAAVVILALLADEIGIGTGRGFGYYQMIILIVGIVLVLVGGSLLLQHRINQRKDDFEPES